MISSLFLTSCETERIVRIGNENLFFELFNFTSQPYDGAELFVGAIDENGTFVPTESIQYGRIPSNLSPNDLYTNLDECDPFLQCPNDGLQNGFHYFTDDDEFFVLVASFEEDVIWQPDLDQVLEISDNIGFLLRLSNGTEGMIGGFNLRATFIDNPIPLNTLTKIFIRDEGIDGETIF
jgi:hypothetical protein